MHQIIITVDPQGQATVKAEGVQGPSCSLKTRPFIEALGQRVRELPTPEFYAQSLTPQEVTNS